MRRLWTVLAAAALAALLAGPALAVGLGGYVELGGGSGEMEVDGYEYDVDAGYASLGFALESAPAGAGLFSYRLEVGIDSLAMNFNFDEYGGDDDTLELGGLTVGNTFAFGIVRKPAFRLWVGPEVRVGFYGGEFEDNDDVEVSLVGFGLGGAVGANIYPNPQGKFAICPSLGLRQTWYSGEWEDDTGDGDLDGDVASFFLNVAFLFGR